MGSYVIRIEMNLNFYDLGGLGLGNIDKFKKVLEEERNITRDGYIKILFERADPFIN